MTLEGIFRRRRLPHLDVADATFFVTSCLADSIPARGLLDLRKYRARLNAQARPAEQSESEWEIRKHKFIFARFDQWLDFRPAVRYLDNPGVAKCVRNSLYHFAGERYELIAFVVMPSHFHWVFHPRTQWCEAIVDREDRRTPRERIMHSIKSYTARKCNQLLQRSGVFWQDESYDHCVRNDDELGRIVEYVEMNPVNAKLVVKAEHWPFSSAHDRLAWKVPLGEPLVPRD